MPRPASIGAASMITSFSRSSRSSSSPSANGGICVSNLSVGVGLGVRVAHLLLELARDGLADAG